MLDTHKLITVLPENVISQLDDALTHFEAVDTPLRLCHLLAQCAHESGGFKLVEENLNYSAQRLLQVFPRFFDAPTAQKYAHHAEKIANTVYAKRMGNGNFYTGDGYRYRGRGYIQLTGRSNYARLSEFVGEDLLKNPDLVSTKYPLLSACFFFEDNQLWKWCDAGSTEVVVKNVTRRVNGGYNGLQGRIEWFNKIHRALLDIEGSHEQLFR